MPWKETRTVDERRKFIEEWLRLRLPVSQLAGQFGVSRKTAYKWLERYHQGGLAGMADLTRAPKRRPHAVSADVAEAIIALREKHRFWGPKKLKAWLEANVPDASWPAASTIGDLLKARGLIEPRRPRHRTPLSTQPLAAATEPNVVWSADFKGQFKVAARWCHPLTISDNASRYLFAVQSVASERESCVRPVFEATFREHGLPYRLRTDNGPPFATKAVGGLSGLSVWLVKLGIVPERIEPGQPQQNGRHERMHRTLKAETALPPMPTAELQQHAFDAFRRDYNEQRPHEALGQVTPASVHRPSTRTMPSEAPDPDYPPDFIVRRIFRGGLSWGGTVTYLATVLTGEAVGLEEIDDGVAQLWFGPIYLGLARQTGNKQVEIIANRP